MSANPPSTNRTLADLSTGQAGLVTELHSQGPVRRRMMDLGIVPGTLVSVEMKSPLGDPVAYHPPRESQLHKLADSLVVVVDEQEVLIASSQPTSYTATVTTNANMVQIGRQFVWMELFAHRIFSQLGADVIDRLSADDRQVLESVAGPFWHK